MINSPEQQENAWRKTEQENRPCGFAGGLAWLIAIGLGVLGMAAMARHGCRTVAVIPIGISLFFIFMFMVGHRREQRRLAASRWVNNQSCCTPPAQEVRLEAQVLPRADDASLRKLYDRFDVRAIEECRANSMDAKAITAFLEMARDFVDTAHAAALINRREMSELDTHMNAALERAKLQFELGTPGAFKATAKREPYPEEPPF